MSTKPLRVLIVEDSESDAALTLEDLQRGGFDVVASRVESEQAFVAALESDTWDVILCDFRMPAFSGLSALALYKTMGLDIPFIFVSGAMGEDLAVEAMRAGAHDYVMKDNLKRLVPAVERELRDAQERIDRRRTKSLLNESERTFSTLAEELPNMIFINKMGTIVYANRKCEEIMGYTKKELYDPNFNFLTLVAPEQVELVKNSFDQHAKNMDVSPYEYTLRTKDNKKLEGILTTKLITFEGERAVLGIVTDVTERKAAENRLRESESLLRESQRVARIGSYATDFVTGYWKGSEVLDEIFGIDKNFHRTIDGWVNLVHPDHRQEMSEYLREIAAKKLPFYKEYRIVRQNDREERWVLGRGELTYDQFGTLTAMIGTIQDITDRKKVEEALHLQVSALKSAANSVVITDTQGVIQWVNPAFTKMTGYGFDEVVGKNPRFLKSGRQKSALYENLWKTILSGKVWNGEIVNKRKDGTFYNEEMTITPVMTSDGKIRNFIAVKQDVTEHKNAEKRQKALESQLAQAQKLESLGTLAGGIAHDFNNILGIILGHVSLLAQSRNDPIVLSNSVDTVTKAVRRGASLVRQILTFARKTEIAREPVNVNSLIVELIKMLQETFPRTIEIVTDLDASVPVLAMDQTQLQQAIMNLCINARDAMTERSDAPLPKGTLTIRTSLISEKKMRESFPDASASEYVCLEISDTGVGMSEATKEKIFEPFFTTKEPGKGTGLGLAVVYGVVKGHQGYIHARSEVGKGTTFTVFFPSSKADIVGPESQHATPTIQLRGSETILVVEDEESILNLMTTVLVRAGYTVIAARDGVEAIDQYEKYRKEVALVLTDMGLPKLDGTEVFTMLKLRDPKVKVVLASGYLEPQYRSELLKTGAKDFVQKPYDPNEVLKKIRAILDVK